MKRIFATGALAFTLLLTGLGMVPAAIAQGGMPDDPAAMMMKMMNERPKDLKKADVIVMKAKQWAMKKGMYACCLKHPCDSCALKMGSCPCGKMAAMDKPVCNECKGGWAADDGAIPGKTPGDIKTFPRMDMKMDGKMMGTTPAASSRVVIGRVCPMTGEKVVGPGAGMSRVGDYEAHFCCAGCKPTFDKLTKSQQLQKIHAALGQG